MRPTYRQTEFISNGTLSIEKKGWISFRKAEIVAIAYHMGEYKDQTLNVYFPMHQLMSAFMKGDMDPTWRMANAVIWIFIRELIIFGTRA